MNKVPDLKSFFSFLNERDDSRYIQSLISVLYEFKKLPSDIFGKKAKITGKIGDMDVDLTVEFEPEKVKHLLSLYSFLDDYYKEQKRAMTKK